MDHCINTGYMICKDCKKDLDEEFFYLAPSNRRGRALYCKPCMCVRNRERSYRAGRHAPRKPPLSAEEKAQRRRLYQTRNRERLNKYYRDRRKNDPQYCMKRRLRRRADRVLLNRTKKHSELLGCTGEELCNHLETTFTDGMSWDNKGLWEIDHIKPLASFDLSQESEQLKAFHYTNVQALWRKDNLRKGAQLPNPIS